MSLRTVRMSVVRTNGWPLRLLGSNLAPATVVAATPTRAIDCGAWQTGKRKKVPNNEHDECGAVCGW